MLLLAAAVSDAPAPVDPTAPPTPRPACVNCDYDTPPKLLRRPPPDYPTEAVMAGIEGMVVIELAISEAGEPTDVRVVESIPALDAAALENARQWRFAPALKDGTPVKAVVYGQVRFHLGEKRGQGYDYDTPPKMLRKPPPVYPPAAAVKGAEGAVFLEMTVSEKGEPTDVRVEDSIPALDAAAVDNVQRWRFEPARKGGKKVRARVYGEVRFRLAGGEDETSLSRSLIALPEAAKEGVPELVKRLAQEEVDVRANAALLLSTVPDPGPEARTMLTAALDDTSSTVRDRAAVALFAMKDPAAQSVFAVDPLPEIVARHQATFPPGLDKAVQGRVDLQLLVSEMGRVIQVKVDQRAAPALDNAALVAASHWRYEPRLVEGKPRPFVVRVLFRFQHGLAQRAQPRSY
jgi:protein TonB